MLRAFERDRRAEKFAHPPLQGEGRTAEGSPGWGAPPPGALRAPTSTFQGEVVKRP